MTRRRSQVVAVSCFPQVNPIRNGNQQETAMATQSPAQARKDYKSQASRQQSQVNQAPHSHTSLPKTLQTTLISPPPPVPIQPQTCSSSRLCSSSALVPWPSPTPCPLPKTTSRSAALPPAATARTTTPAAAVRCAQLPTMEVDSAFRVLNREALISSLVD